MCGDFVEESCCSFPVFSQDQSNLFHPDSAAGARLDRARDVAKANTNLHGCKINLLLIEAIRFKVEQRMEGARKDRHVTQNTMPQFVAQ